MKKKLLLCVFAFMNATLFFAQNELKAELVNGSGKILSQCDCEKITANSQVMLRVYFTQNVFKYDKLEMTFHNKTTGAYIAGDEVSGDKLRVEYQPKGYIDFLIAEKKGNEMTRSAFCAYAGGNFEFIGNAKGFFITGYKESVFNNTITRSAIYGDEQSFGSTPAFTVIVDEKLSAETKKSNKRAKRFGIATAIGGGAISGGAIIVDNMKKK